MIDIGLCAGLEKAGEAKALGFDYLEPPVTGIASLSETAFADALAQVRQTGLPVRRCNCLFPGSLPLCGEDLRADRVAAWLQAALPRVRALGAELVVFGSGGARKRPEQVPYATAFRRLVQVTRLIGDVCAANGLRVAIEPLNPGETNMINTVAEGAALAAAADHPVVGLLADSYHIALTGEDPADLVRLGGVWHVHVALKEGRRWPVAADALHASLFAALRASGYKGCVSVEGNSADWQADAAAALPLLRGWTREA